MCIYTHNKDNRVMIFIDCDNVRRSVRSLDPEYHVDFVKMVFSLLDYRKNVGVYLYDACVPGDENCPFFKAMKSYGFRLNIREFDPEIGVQKEVDVAMACDMLEHAMRDHYDTAIIVSGDRDFVPVLEKVQNSGKLVEVAAYKQNCSQKLMQCADSYTDLHGLPLITMHNLPSEEECTSFNNRTEQEAEA